MKIIFSDESHIHQNCSFNKQNCRKWSTSKRSFNFSVPLHSPKITVWCGISSKKIYSLFFFEDSETGEATTITTESYLRMLQVIFDDGIDWMRGIDWMKQRFQGKLNSIKGEFPWPARPVSTGLSPLGAREIKRIWFKTIEYQRSKAEGDWSHNVHLSRFSPACNQELWRSALDLYCIGRRYFLKLQIKLQSIHFPMRSVSNS